MKISELAIGKICRVPGIGIELELLAVNLAGAYVRPTGEDVRRFRGDSGEDVVISTRRKPFLISGGTEVELTS